MRLPVMLLAASMVLSCAQKEAETVQAAAVRPSNRSPVIGPTVDSEVDTKMEYDDEGALTGARTTITLKISASDPDGDPLTYTWTCTGGEVNPEQNSAVWTGARIGEKAVVTVTDGKGGESTHEFVYTKGETITVYTP